MYKFFNKNKYIKRKRALEETYKELRVKEYINKYIKELQRHFDITDYKMRSIVLQVYKDLSPLNLIKSWISMVKSKYIKKLKRELK